MNKRRLRIKADEVIEVVDAANKDSVLLRVKLSADGYWLLVEGVASSRGISHDMQAEREIQNAMRKIAE